VQRVIFPRADNRGATHGLTQLSMRVSSLSHSLLHTHTHKLSHSHILFLTLSLSLSHIHTNSLIHTLTHTISLSHTLSLSHKPHQSGFFLWTIKKLNITSGVRVTFLCVNKNLQCYDNFKKKKNGFEPAIKYWILILCNGF